MATLQDASAPPSVWRRFFSIDFSAPRHRSKFGYLLIAPATILMALIIVYPLLLSVNISFQNVKIARIGEEAHERQPQAGRPAREGDAQPVWIMILRHRPALLLSSAERPTSSSELEVKRDVDYPSVWPLR